MDQQLITYLESCFNEISKQIAASREETSQLREETSQQFTSLQEDLRRVEEKADKTQILLEDIRDHIRILAEGFIGYSEKLDSIKVEPTLKVEEILALITPFYQGLDSRLRIMEGWADRQNEDVLELVRRRVLGARQEPL